MSQQVAHAPPGALRQDVVVVEIPRAAFSGPEDIERLLRDAQILAATTVGPMVKILEVDTSGDPVSVVTEHVPGTTLTELLDDGPLPARQAIPILEDVAAALRVMAWQGVVHGSVGPEHVIVLPDGRARLGGFAVSGALATTEPDQWSDAYDFAVLAHHTLAGGPPPLAPNDPWPPLPWRAAEVLLSGLTDRPQERPLPHELVQVLRGVLHEDPTVSPAPERVTEPEPEPDDDYSLWSSMPPRWFRWICIALGLIVTGGAAAAGAYLLEPWRMSSNALEVRDISVAAEPGLVVRCPHAEVRFVATIATNGNPGELTISWIHPDGAQPQARTVEVREGQDSVQSQISFTFRGREARSGRAVVLVDGDDAGSASKTVKYLCAGG